MQTLTVANMTFVADSTGVSVVLGARVEGKVKLSSREAGRLEEFLRHNAPRERRVGFRVRVAPLPGRVRSSFKVRLSVGDEIHDVRPVDVSLTGLLVEATDFQVRRGMELPAELQLGELSCSLTGSVVRQDGDLLALHFVDSIRDGELNPPESLLAIYRVLETEWLRRRI